MIEKDCFRRRYSRPQNKGSAEASVRFAETWIIAAQRDRKFFSVCEMNEALAEKLEDLNVSASDKM